MLCWLFRFMISDAADNESNLSPATQRHVDKCSDCKSFYETSLSMGQTLKRQAAELNEDLPAHFAQRVLEAAPDRTDRTYKIAPKSWHLALAAACIVIVASLTVPLLTLNQPDPPQHETARTDGLYRLIDDGNPAALAGLVERPLSNEIDNLAESTESAVRFLVACVAVNPTGITSEVPN